MKVLRRKWRGGIFIFNHDPMWALRYLSEDIVVTRSSLEPELRLDFRAHEFPDKDSTHNDFALQTHTSNIIQSYARMECDWSLRFFNVDDTLMFALFLKWIVSVRFTEGISMLPEPARYWISNRQKSILFYVSFWKQVNLSNYRPLPRRSISSNEIDCKLYFECHLICFLHSTRLWVFSNLTRCCFVASSCSLSPHIRECCALLEQYI